MADIGFYYVVGSSPSLFDTETGQDFKISHMHVNGLEGIVTSGSLIFPEIFEVDGNKNRGLEVHQ